MPLVNVMVNQRAYTIACDDGEEEHLKELAGHVDAKVRELLETRGPGWRCAASADGGASHHRRLFRCRATGSMPRAKELGDLSGAHDEMNARLDQFEGNCASKRWRQASKRVEDIAARLAQA